MVYRRFYMFKYGFYMFVFVYMYLYVSVNTYIHIYIMYFIIYIYSCIYLLIYGLYNHITNQSKAWDINMTPADCGYRLLEFPLDMSWRTCQQSKPYQWCLADLTLVGDDHPVYQNQCIVYFRANQMRISELMLRSATVLYQWAHDVTWHDWSANPGTTVLLDSGIIHPNKTP